MKGKHKGVQKRILDVNPKASYVPCSPLNLNLPVNDSAKWSIKAVDFYGIMQQVNFLSASIERWQIFCKYLSRFTVKPLSYILWSSRTNTIKRFLYQIGEFYYAFIEINGNSGRSLYPTLSAVFSFQNQKLSIFLLSCNVA